MGAGYEVQSGVFPSGWEHCKNVDGTRSTEIFVTKQNIPLAEADLTGWARRLAVQVGSTTLEGYVYPVTGIESITDQISAHAPAM